MKLVAYVDGGCDPNPGGPMGIGVSLHEPGEGRKPGKVVKQVADGFPAPGTNNRAEYLAIVRALEEAKKLGADEVQLRADSALTVNQLTGKFRILKPELRELARRIEGLAEEFESVAFEWVPREENKDADRLSTQGLLAAKGVKEPARKTQLGSAATEKAAAKYSVEARACPRCGKPCTFAWQRFADGTWHVRQQCPEHGYVRYTPSEEPFLTLAGKRPG